MSDSTRQDVRRFVLDHLAGELATAELSPANVNDDLDLLVEQVIDSFGLLELIIAVEHRYGVHLDFENLDADDMTMVGPFCQYVEAQVAMTSEP